MSEGQEYITICILMGIILILGIYVRVLKDQKEYLEKENNELKTRLGREVIKEEEWQTINILLVKGKTLVVKLLLLPATILSGLEKRFTE